VGIVLATVVFVLAPIGRPTDADLDPGPSPVPMSAIAVPSGGAAIVHWSMSVVETVTARR